MEKKLPVPLRPSDQRERRPSSFVLYGQRIRSRRTHCTGRISANGPYKRTAHAGSASDAPISGTWWREFQQFAFDLVDRFAGRELHGLATRNTCVHRQRGSPKALVQHYVRRLATDARRPPARPDHAAPHRHGARSVVAAAIAFLALLRKSPMVLMCSESCASPSATRSAGSLHERENRVAAFTDLSVVCADSSTAITS